MRETMPTDQELNAKVAAWMGWERASGCPDASDPLIRLMWMAKDGVLLGDPTSDPRAWAAVKAKCVKRGWYPSIQHLRDGVRVSLRSGVGRQECFATVRTYTQAVADTEERAGCLAVVQAMAGEGVEG